MCCVCIECGEPTPYTGQHKICEMCGLKKTVESNLRHQKSLKDTLAGQQERLARLESFARLNRIGTPAGIAKRVK
jgi:hypothetical protein